MLAVADEVAIYTLIDGKIGLVDNYRVLDQVLAKHLAWNRTKVYVPTGGPKSASASWLGVRTLWKQF